MSIQPKQGFTLIEILVVVLIIAILSAVAVSQYQKAVEKTRATAMLPLLKAIGEAQENYYLENGRYATSFAQLPISIPLTGTTKWCTLYGCSSARADEDWSLQLYPPVNVVIAGRLRGTYAGAGLAYFYGDWACPPKNGWGVCAHTLTCIIKGENVGGITKGGSADKYCRDIFGATKTVQSGTIGSFRAMPH